MVVQVHYSYSANYKQTVVNNHLCRDLEQEIARYKEEAKKQRNIIEMMERERNNFVEETADLTQKLFTKMDEKKELEIQLSDYRKKMAEVESKIRVQHSINEKVIEERDDLANELGKKQVTDSKTLVNCASIGTSAQCVYLPYCRQSSRNRNGR